MCATKTPVSILQEYCIKNLHAVPEYSFTHIPAMGNQLNQFKCHLKINKDIEGFGNGSSKQNAKHEAAKEVLDKLRVQTVVTNIRSADDEVFSNYVGRLNEFCSKNSHPYPNYTEAVTENGEFIIYCLHLNKTTFGVDIKKKQAKQKAAKEMISRYEDGDNGKRLSQQHVPENNNIINNNISAAIDQVDFPKVQNLNKHIETKPKALNGNNYLKDSTVQDLLNQMKKLQIKCNIKEIQREPLMLAVEYHYPDGEENTQLITKNFESSLETCLKEGLEYAVSKD